MQERDGVRYERAGGVVTLTLAAPERRNRLDPSMMTALLGHLHAAAADETARVVVLTGEGSTFCAGADLSSGEDFASSGPARLVEVLEALLDLPKPVIARVQGHVAGGGNGLVAACDLAVAADTARFAFSEVRVGVAPAVISVVCLARMNAADAREVMLTGARVDAERVRAAGLVNHVVAPEQLDSAVDAYVEALLLGGPQALAHTKELLRRVPGMTRDEAFAWTADLSARASGSAAARAGVAAFVAKRPPRWLPPASG